MSIMNVESPTETLSMDLILVKILSTSPSLASSAGTKLPICARNTIRATWKIKLFFLNTLLALGCFYSFYL